MLDPANSAKFFSTAKLRILTAQLAPASVPSRSAYRGARTRLQSSLESGKNMESSGNKLERHAREKALGQFARGYGVKVIVPKRKPKGLPHILRFDFAAYRGTSEQCETHLLAVPTRHHRSVYASEIIPLGGEAQFSGCERGGQQ
jgi:hypothetical protein